MRYALGLLLLGAACGRTPIDAFAGDMAREEIFDPIVDGCSKVDDALLEAKGGHDEAIVVLSIAHTEEDTCTAHGHAVRATNLLALTRQFEHGVTASICAQTFEEPFARTTDVIRSACGE